MVDAPGAELPAVLLAIKRGARDFYTKSHAWREVGDVLSTVSGVYDYDILDIENVEVIAIRDVSVGRDAFETGDNPFDRYLTPSQMRRCHVMSPNATGAPEFAAYIDDRLWFHPAPATTDEQICATLILRPTYKRDSLPIGIFQEHQDSISLGALWYLKNSMGKPYSDPAGAAQASAQFMEACAHYLNQADTGGAQVPRETNVQFI